VNEMMTHGPCGDSNPTALYIIAKEPGGRKKCLKNFLKAYVNNTYITNNSYPYYY